MGVSLGDIEKRTGGDQQMVGRVRLTQDALMKSGLNPHMTEMEGVLVLDHSGSMDDEYRDGLVQQATERGLAFVSTVDPDGKAQVVFFDSKAHDPREVSLENYRGWVDGNRPRRMGTTNLADAIYRTMEVASNQLSAPGIRDLIRARDLRPVSASRPVFALLITDGVPDREHEARDALIRASYAPIFWKILFVSNDPSGKRFLQELDDMDGRHVDNADTVYFTDGLGRITDESFTDEVVRELAPWLQVARQKGLLA